MVVEYIRYVVPAARVEEFDAAYRKAGTTLRADAHCLRYEVAKGIEEPERYTVRIEWDSVEGHERGFRASPGFRELFAAVKSFFEQTEAMKHYQALDQ